MNEYKFAEGFKEEALLRLWMALGCPEVQEDGEIIYRFNDVDERRAQRGEEL